MIGHSFFFILLQYRRFCAGMPNLQINDKQHTRCVYASRHLCRFYKTTVCKLYRKHGRILYNMAFNLRRIRCLATQTTAIGFHLMNQARAFGSIFVLWARLKLNVLPFLFHPLPIFAHFISISCDLRLDGSTWYRKLLPFYRQQSRL